MTAIVKTLAPTGMLDGATTNELRILVTEVIQQGADIVLLDMKGVNFMNSSGIGALVAILKMVRAKEKQLYLCGLNDQVNMIFQLTKMDRVFKLFVDPGDFEAKVLAA
ncbi:MAG: STAS domain-containing protein [Leptolyngbyaceae cyanobacterium MO_188.B28]|nr:STAS domain-containing protein [Leptolyngbyaceae cyanobacterium MO_188.B28]